MNANIKMEPKVVNTRQGLVEYAEYGEGPAVIALHGAMGGYDQSLLLGRTVGGDGYRYIGVSRPGYLGTPLACGKTPEQQADLCAALLDTLGIDSAAVVAVSGGGPCALHFALRYQQRCRCLVLISTCGGKVDTPIPFSFKLTMLLVRLPGFANAMQKKALANMEQMVNRSISDPVVRARTLQDPEAGPLFMELIESTCDRMDQRMPGTANDIAITRTIDYPLEKIAVPVMIIHGTEDKMVPYTQHAKTLEARIPGAELLTIEGGEHVSIFTNREQVRERVVRFMNEHSPVAVGSVKAG